MVIETTLSYTGEDFKLWSWDNHYAATLVETGVTGLAVFVLLFMGVTFSGVAVIRKNSGEERNLLAAIFAAQFSLIFMMSNVAIFAPQISYLFWSLAAIGCCIKRTEKGEESVQNSV